LQLHQDLNPGLADLVEELILDVEMCLWHFRAPVHLTLRSMLVTLFQGACMEVNSQTTMTVRENPQR
jgi:hypothetical protein